MIKIEPEFAMSKAGFGGEYRAPPAWFVAAEEALLVERLVQVAADMRLRPLDEAREPETLEDDDAGG